MNKHSNLFFIIILVLLAKNAQAQCPGNWLLGVSGGYGESKGDLYSKLTYTTRPLSPITEIIHEHSEKGSLWGIFAGYQIAKRGWIFGAELAVDWQDFDQSKVFAFTDAVDAAPGALAWKTNYRLTNNWNLGLSGRIAYEMAPYFIPFLRAGVERTHEELQVTYAVPVLLVQPFTLNTDHWHNRYIVGFGAEAPLPIYTCPSVRIEYNYHAFFNDNAVEVSGIQRDGILNTAFVSEMHPRTHIVKLSIVWNIKWKK